ncbi:hypothetical protein DXG01_000670, partial [Tephrocybe rancida]
METQKTLIKKVFKIKDLGEDLQLTMTVKLGDFNFPNPVISRNPSTDMAMPMVALILPPSVP